MCTHLSSFGIFLLASIRDLKHLIFLFVLRGDLALIFLINILSTECDIVASCE